MITSILPWVCICKDVKRMKQRWATGCQKCIKCQLLCTARCALRKTKQARGKLLKLCTLPSLPQGHVVGGKGRSFYRLPFCRWWLGQNKWYETTYHLVLLNSWSPASQLRMLDPHAWRVPEFQPSKGRKGISFRNENPKIGTRHWSRIKAAKYFFEKTTCQRGANHRPDDA